MHVPIVEGLESGDTDDASFDSVVVFLWASDDVIVVLEITGIPQILRIRATLCREILHQLGIVVVRDNQPNAYFAHDQKIIWTRHLEHYTW